MGGNASPFIIDLLLSRCELWHICSLFKLVKWVECLSLLIMTIGLTGRTWIATWLMITPISKHGSKYVDKQPLISAIQHIWSRSSVLMCKVRQVYSHAGHITHCSLLLVLSGNLAGYWHFNDFTLVRVCLYMVLYYVLWSFAQINRLRTYIQQFYSLSRVTYNRTNT